MEETVKQRIKELALGIINVLESSPVMLDVKFPTKAIASARKDVDKGKVHLVLESPIEWISPTVKLKKEILAWLVENTAEITKPDRREAIMSLALTEAISMSNASDRRFTRRFTFACAAVCLLLCVIVGFLTNWANHQNQYQWQQQKKITQAMREKVEAQSAGVVVRGYDTDGWLVNNNDFAVRIKAVGLKRYSGGHEVFAADSTLSIKVLLPGEIERRWVQPGLKFFVLNMAGGEIGLIIPQDPYQYSQPT
ncbi:MAG: hypothetical protein WC508_01800 [Patescibacteria group bacterium]